jgi:hypothetical protein
MLRKQTLEQVVFDLSADEWENALLNQECGSVCEYLKHETAINHGASELIDKASSASAANLRNILPTIDTLPECEKFEGLCDAFRKAFFTFLEGLAGRSGTERKRKGSPMTVEERLENIESLLAALFERQTFKDWYSVDEFACILGKAEFTVREWCRLGRIHAEKKGSGRGVHPYWVISHTELLRYQREGLLLRGRKGPNER